MGEKPRSLLEDLLEGSREAAEEKSAGPGHQQVIISADMDVWSECSGWD